jgi:hypothetical protein
MEAGEESGGEAMTLDTVRIREEQVRYWYL